MREHTRLGLLCTAIPALALLSACGGGASGGVASTPAPPPTAAPPPAPASPPPAPVGNFDTAEYRRSNAAAQAQALNAYANGATGAGITVGVIDSGVNDVSPEFAGRISPASADFAGGRGIRDEGGHGTAVSSVLLAARNDSGIQGVAFNANLFVGRSDTPGSCAGSSSTFNGCSHNDNAMAAALDGAVAAGARIVNISLGGSPANMNLRNAISRATAAGTIIVFSGGNIGATDPANAVNPDPLAQIANEPLSRGLVVVAGAVDATGSIASFSNRAGNSAAYFITALGVRVQSNNHTGSSLLYSGTSFSAPVVSGALALLAQAFPNLTSAQLIELLYRSADDRGDPGVDAIYGRGEVNIARAFSPIGATSLAGSKVPVSLTGNATLGSAMGDAGGKQGSMNAVIRDEFGRDFMVDLSGTLHRRAGARPLLAGLSKDARTLAAAGGRMTIALSIDDRRDPRHLALTGIQAESARVLAGAVALRLSSAVQLGLGAGRSANGLLAKDDDPLAPAFLVVDRSLDRAPLGAFALRRKVGGLGLTLAAESGDMRLWERGEQGIVAWGVRRFPYSELSLKAEAALGPIAVTGHVSRFDERATVLGSRFGAVLGGGGARTWFADAEAKATFDGWQARVAWQQGWTRMDGGTLRTASTLASRALSAHVARTGVWTAEDRLALRYSKPLRVTSGSLDLRLPGVAAQSFALSPAGRERDWELVYTRPLGPGWLTANAFHRKQPGHFALARDDAGAALRYSLAF